MTLRQKLEAVALIALAAAAMAGMYVGAILYSPASGDVATKIVMVNKGVTLRSVALHLEREGLIRSASGFFFVAKLAGGAGKIRAGEYEFSPSTAPIHILDALMKGRVKRYAVTIPEGYNIYDVARVVAEAGLGSKDELVEKAKGADAPARHGVEGPTLEGYIYPDTYFLEKGMSADEILSRMVKRFKAVYDAEFAVEAGRKGFSMKRLVTIASIIEKETGAGHERPSISAVFHNRLKKRIKLQSDPTVIYGIIENFDGNITKRHLQTPTPYNTYTNFGLPEGPIANPGRDSLRAALNPSGENYLYFVSKNDGSHQFSRTLVEHNAAVNRYQKKAKPVKK